jgi:hypothetical protein
MLPVSMQQRTESRESIPTRLFGGHQPEGSAPTFAFQGAAVSRRIGDPRLFTNRVPTANPESQSVWGELLAELRAMKTKVEELEAAQETVKEN